MSPQRPIPQAGILALQGREDVKTRTLARWWRGEVLWGTNRESLRMALSPDSILWWAWSTHARRRASYERELAQVPYQVVRLRTRKEVDRWLERI
jgi:hypothetical protein